MAVNDLSFSQIATVLGSIQAQATGQAAVTATNTSEFVVVAQNTLKMGYDPVMNAISQVLSRTIFSNRAYQPKFAGLRMDAMRYGNHVRKLQPIDKPFEDDSRISLVDGASVDMFTVNKPKAVQTNFYGESIYQKSLTVFRDQLDTAFSGPEEFAQFISMIMQNAADQIAQAHENTARATVANLIGGCIKIGGTQHFKLVTRWNEYTGNADTWASIKAESVKFKEFVSWMYAEIKTLAGYMTERSALYHSNIYDGTQAVAIMRHTPLARMKAYILTEPLNQIESNVFANIFNPEYLKLVDHEEVNFWQGLQTPMDVHVNCNYYDSATGAILSDEAHNDLVLGVLFDEEAAGYTTVNEWSAASPFNAKGGYYNMFWHFTDRYYNDFTENCVVLTLE